MVLLLKSAATRKMRRSGWLETTLAMRAHEILGQRFGLVEGKREALGVLQPIILVLLYYTHCAHKGNISSCCPGFQFRRPPSHELGGLRTVTRPTEGQSKKKTIANWFYGVIITLVNTPGSDTTLHRGLATLPAHCFQLRVGQLKALDVRQLLTVLRRFQ